MQTRPRSIGVRAAMFAMTFNKKPTSLMCFVARRPHHFPVFQPYCACLAKGSRGIDVAVQRPWRMLRFWCSVPPVDSMPAMGMAGPASNLRSRRVSEDPPSELRTRPTIPDQDATMRTLMSCRGD
jgi:hypothetical protein